MSYDSRGRKDVWKGKAQKMRVPPETKERLKKEIAECLSESPEVQRVIVFFTFVTSNDPHDLDIAVFKDSD